MPVNRRVQTVTEQSRGGKGGWLIVWQDGKEDFTFTEELVNKAREAFKNGAEVVTSYEKNRKGYWNLAKIEPLGSEPREETSRVARGKYPDGEMGGSSEVEVEEVPFDTPPPEPRPPFISGEERGMWFKELGNRIGDGSIERDYPKAHIKIKGQYYKKMSEVTGVDFH